MDLSDDLLEQIGAYLSGQLPAQEKDQFEARLQQDPDLRQEVAIQRELKQGLSFLAQKDRFKQMHADLARRGLLTEDANRAEQTKQTEPQPPETKVVPFPESQPVQSASRFGRASWVMAASLALLLGIGWLVYSNQREKRQELAQNERIFNRYFSPDLRSAPPLPTDPDRVAAPDNGQAASDSAGLHSAIQSLQRADVQSAVNELKAISTRQPGHWSASAQWYLALAYLRNNQRADSQQLLQKISQLTGHPYQKQAQQLLTQLSPAVPSSR